MRAGSAIIGSVMNSRGNNPKRRIVQPGFFTQPELVAFAAHARYDGSALHKTRPADYGFHPPTNPRPSKSVCDDIRMVPLDEARQLFREGLDRGMVSACQPPNLPKYVWAVDEDGEAYEAKLGSGGRYHGYRLGLDERDMREWVQDEWQARTP